MIRLSLLLLLAPLLGCAQPFSQISEDPISISEIKPGDPGVWRTVVSGREVQTFPLEVVGVIESFVGPGMPIILCRAVDEENTMTGPVSGMSGSPVYINGRLAGAYAYGFPWSKEKTLIGVTPIEWMNPLLGYPDRPYRETPFISNETTATTSLGLPASFEALPTSGSQESGPQALPVPLLTSGVSVDVLRVIQPWLDQRGLRLTAGGAGGVATSGEDLFTAGSPLAVILASGDLRIGGVGTITRREGDRLIAFGHPMLGSGSVELPIGGAEIVDVVSNYRISFKLSNIGEVAGTLWQDSTPGIQGELGRIPYMIPIQVASNVGIKKVVAGKLAEHRNFTPSMALTYAAQSLLTATEGPEDATIRGKISIAIEDEEEPLELTRRGIGFSGAVDILFSFADAVNMVLNGSQEFPRLENIDVSFETEPGEKRQILHSVRLETARVKAGGSVQLTIINRKRNGETATHTVEIPLPNAPAGSNFSVHIADASAIRSFDRIATYDPTRPFSELLTELRQLRDNGSIYIQLLRPMAGLRLEGRNLEELPPSVLRLYQSTLEQPGDQFLSESIAWETSIPVPGVFTGNSRINFQTEP